MAQSPRGTTAKVVRPRFLRVARALTAFCLRDVLAERPWIYAPHDANHLPFTIKYENARNGMKAILTAHGRCPIHDVNLAKRDVAVGFGEFLERG